MGANHNFRTCRVANRHRTIRYIEVESAYKGAMTSEQVEEAILDRTTISELSIGANSCNTLAQFNLAAAKAALAAAKGEQP